MKGKIGGLVSIGVLMVITIIGRRLEIEGRRIGGIKGTIEVEEEEVEVLMLAGRFIILAQKLRIRYLEGISRR